MAIKTAQEYLKSLEERRLRLYLFGEQVQEPAGHPIVRPSVNSAAETYEMANDAELAELATATSHLTGERISRFTHIHQSTDDLICKVNLLRRLGQRTCSCFQRCVGMDALNALYSVTFEIDRDEGTAYHPKFIEYLKYVQSNDLMLDGAMTDPKGDRSLGPSQQADPDLYLRIVRETPEGIVVRGAKAHQTGCVNCHEIVVLPTASLAEEDKDYAVSFALPLDTDGITCIYGRQSSDTRKLEPGPCGTIDCGNAKYGGQEVLVVFDDVFAPWNRVFMCREYRHASTLVERFAAYHRQSYGGCKVGVGDVLIGAAALIAEYNGVAKASHIKDKICEMIHLNETLYACGIACSSQGTKTAAGNYLVNVLLANVCKQNVTRFPFEIARLLQDIAGGLMVTLPSAKDFESPVVGPCIEKYLKGVASVPTEHRIRLLRLIENMTLGTGAVCYLTESLHGAGSPQAQRVMIFRQTDLGMRKELAKACAGIVS
jgi:4-hydroxybutyryl-CoA dehydratase / vinylacetyl-CoA-Delta-isomerase